MIQSAPLLRTHLGAVCTGIVAGLIVVAPQLIFMFSAGEQYRGLYMLNTDAEPHYLARMQSAVEGNGIGNPFVIEGRDEVPSGFFSYSEQILAAPAHVLPIGILDLNLFYKFLLPVILALLMYALVYRLSGSQSWGIVGALALTLSSTAFNIGTFLNILHGSTIYQQFLLFSRPVSPVLYVIFLLVFLHVLVSHLRKPRYFSGFILALLLGLSWYLFIYLATFLTALLGTYVLWYLLARRGREAIWLTAITLLGLITAIPATLNLHAITQSPYYQFFVGPIGLQASHAPYIHAPLLIIAALCGWYWYKHRSFPHARETFTLLLASLVVMNQQVITGLSLHPGHYITYFCIPAYLVVLALLASEFFKSKSPAFVLCFQGAISLYAVVAGIFILHSSYIFWAPKTIALQRDIAPIEWLNAHSAPESVVMANGWMSQLIPAYTKNNVMWEVHANSYLMPESRWNFTPENALRAKDFCSFLKQYQLDYAVWDRESDPAWNLDQKRCLRPVAEMEGFTIYEHQ